MTTNSPLQTLTVPVGGDAPDGPTQVTNLAKALEQKLVMVFASAAARTAAFTAANISPAAGMLCWRSDATGLNKFEAYSATAGAWRIHGAYQDSSTVTGSAAPSVTLSSVPTYLRTLRLGIRARGTNASVLSNLFIQVGGDTTGSYSWHKNYSQNTAINGIFSGTAATAADIGYCPGASASGGRFGAMTVDIHGWDNPTANSLSIVHNGGYMDNASNFISSRGAAVYSGSATYNSLTVTCTGSLVVGTEVVLQGWE